MKFIDASIEQYCVEYSEPENPFFDRIRKRTEQEMEAPQMIAGNLVGHFIQLMLRALQAKRVVEVGTFTGYSSLKMAEVLPEDGEVFTFEYSKKHAAVAQEFFDESPWGHKVTLFEGAALENLGKLTAPIDFAFIDADKVNYKSYYEALLEIMRPGGVIVMDNALWSGAVLDPKEPSDHALAEVNAYVHGDTRVSNLLLPIRDGLMTATKK